jgi:hypothetical protein
MAQRKMIPALGGYDIAVVTEHMQDGNLGILVRASPWEEG